MLTDETAASDTALGKGTVTHTDLQKMFPVLSIEAITKLEQRALQKRPHLIAIHGPGYFQPGSCDPIPEDVRIKATFIRQAARNQSHAGCRASAILRPGDVQQATGQECKFGHPSGSQHPLQDQLPPVSH